MSSFRFPFTPSGPFMPWEPGFTPHSMGRRVSRWLLLRTVSALFSIPVPRKPNGLAWHDEDGRSALSDPSRVLSMSAVQGPPDVGNPFPHSEGEHWEWHPGGYICQLVEAVINPVALLRPEDFSSEETLPVSDCWVEPSDGTASLRPAGRGESRIPSASAVSEARMLRESAMCSLSLLLSIGADFSSAKTRFPPDVLEMACVESVAHGWGDFFGASSEKAIASLLAQRILNPVLGPGLLILRKLVERERLRPPRPAVPAVPAPPLALERWRSGRRGPVESSVDAAAPRIEPPPQ